VKVADLVIERLRGLDFTVREDDVRLFGETIPFVRAIAFDAPTRQLVVLAEDESGEAAEWDRHEPAWRDLLFAVSGLRRQLSGSRPPALSQPVLIAVAPGEVAGRLRGLVEQVITEYALFTRIDLNILDAGAADLDAIDRGMASLLPRTREAIRKGITVATQDVEQFWIELETAVGDVDRRFVEKFDAEAVETAVSDLMEELRTDLERPDETEATRKAEPIFGLELRDFRSFAQEGVEIGPTTIVHGTNGSGKTSICEAMEILWSGRTRRIPEGVKAAEYEKHLNFEGRQFHLRTLDDKMTADSIADAPEAILGRTVLPQERLTEMADGVPTQRFRAFLEASGLELPEFEERLKDQLRGALRNLNTAFAEIGVGRVTAVNHDGIKPLIQALQGSFAPRLPSPDRIRSAVAALQRETAGAYKADLGHLVDEIGHAQKRLLDLDIALNEFAAKRRRARSPSAELEDVGLQMRHIVSRLREAAQPLALLVRHLQTTADTSIAAPVQSRPAPRPLPISAALRARWLTQARNLEAEIDSLDQFSKGIEDSAWRGRLDSYLEALRVASSHSSRAELERLVEPESGRSLQEIPSRFEEPAVALVEAAGFNRAPRPTEAIIESILALQYEIVRQADEIEAIADEVESHPAAAFAANAPRIESALCRFELRRELMKPNGALTKAREALVGRLLDQRLTPVVRELVDALVRFEWYFKPLEVEVRGRELRLHGLATDDPKLDIRMLLNAAERTIVGIAWFLGLHVTQERSDRKVLILDDPASGFDETNRAAFISTLSVLLDLLKPAQFLITTHDEALVAALEVELLRPDESKDSPTLLRCRRTESGTSEVRESPLQARLRPDLESELEALHLDFPAPSHAKTE
jgi:hypothetical protein